MKNIILILFGSILLASCSHVNECGNRFDFIATNDSIPILTLDYSETPETTLNKMNNLYGIDLCEKCSWVEFKSPFEIEGQNGYLKLMVDFDSPYCSNCPAKTRLRSYFYVLINRRNQILVQGNLVTLDSLKAEIKSYLSKVGKVDAAPSTYNRVNYSVRWDVDSDSLFIDSVFTSIFSSHTDFVATKVAEEGIDFCSLGNSELAKLKTQYPIRIEISSGIAIEMPSAIEMEEMSKAIEEISRSHSK